MVPNPRELLTNEAIVRLKIQPRIQLDLGKAHDKMSDPVRFHTPDHKSKTP
jgi:hypothetical protein